VFPQDVAEGRAFFIVVSFRFSILFLGGKIRRFHRSNYCDYPGGFLNMASRHCTLTLFVLAALVLSLTSVGLSQVEKKLTSKQLPAAVQASFQKSYPTARIKGASSEVEKGKTLYEVESVDGKINRDLLYEKDGTCVEIEETIPLNALPDEVAKALKKEAGKGKVHKAEKLTKGETIQYEFLIGSGKGKREIVMDPKGKIVRTEKAEETEKEKD
jgi:hypothetical protein